MFNLVAPNRYLVIMKTAWRKIEKFGWKIWPFRRRALQNGRWTTRGRKKARFEVERKRVLLLFLTKWY